MNIIYLISLNDLVFDIKFEFQALRNAWSNAQALRRWKH